MRYRKKLMPPVQEFLFSYEEAVLEVQRLERRAEELESQCSKLAAQYSGSPRGGSGGSPNATWDAFCDALTRVEEQKQEYLRCEAEVEAFIKRLPTPVYRQVLRHYYLERMTWEQVGETMGYSERHARKHHDDALVEAQRLWEKMKEN